MHALTLRNIPADLFAFLRQEAATHHRSLNRQAIAALDTYRRNQLKANLEPIAAVQKREQISLRLASIHNAIKRSNNTQTADEILGFDAQGLAQ